MRDIASRIRITFKALAFIFWVVMIILLARKEFIPRRQSPLISYPSANSLNSGFRFKESWMGIYYDNRKVGYSNTIFQNLADSQKNLQGYTVYHHTLLNIPILGEIRQIEINGNAFFSAQMQPEALQFTVNSGAYTCDIQAQEQGEKLLIQVTSGGRSQQLSIDRDVYLFSMVHPPLFLQALLDGKVQAIKIFDPVSLRCDVARLRLLGQQKYPGGDKVIDVFIVEVVYQGIVVKTWLDADGEIIRQESPLGFIIVKEPKDKALNFPPSEILQKDILNSVSISAGINIAEPAKLKSIKLSLEGVDTAEFDFRTPRQNIISYSPHKTVAVISKEESASLPSLNLPLKRDDLDSFLQPELLIQSDDLRILNQARELVAQEKDALAASLRIFHWVFVTLKKTPALGLPSAVSVLESKAGDCNEHTYLFVSLARAAGIPAQVVTGLILYKGRFYYHTWPKVFVGKWIELDPTLGQKEVDATHIQFIAGGLERQVEIIKLIRKLKINVLNFTLED